PIQRDKSMETQDPNELIETYFKVQRFHFLAEQCLNLVKKSIAELLRPHKINHSQYLILLMLSYAEHAGSDVIATELSFVLGLERHSISALLDKLDSRGFINRKRSNEDRRVVHLSMTEKGKELTKSIQSKTVGRIAVMPEDSASDFTQVYDFLFLLRETIATKNDINVTPYKDAYEKLILRGQNIFQKSDAFKENSALQNDQTPQA
ncbi:MAG: MarR family transcriptional regulator, partial [Sphaerochaetaceae bacterium]